MDNQTPDNQPVAPTPANNGPLPQPPQVPSTGDTRPVYRQMPPSYPTRRPVGTEGITAPGTRPSANPYLRPMNGVRPPQSPQMDVQGPNPAPMRPTSPAPLRPVFQQSQTPSQPQPVPQSMPQQYARPMATPPQQPVSQPYANPPTPQNYQPPPDQASNNQSPQPVAAPPQVPQQQMPPVPAPNTAPAAQPAGDPKKAKSKRSKLRVGLSAVAVLIALAGVGKLGMWVANNYFSPYNNLTTTSYDKGGISYSFKYPASLKFDSLLSGNSGPSNVSITGMQSVTPAAYIYNSSKTEVVYVGISYTPIGKTLQALQLTPNQLIGQIQTGAGSYVNYVNQTSPGLFSVSYQNCNSTIQTKSGTGLTCITRGNVVTIARVVGANANYEYNLTLSMPTSIWDGHQNVWQAVEKSLSIT